MVETVAIVVATIVVPTWIAAVLLALRDRYFPTAPRPERYGPYCPPKWARQHRLVAKITLLALSPVLVLSLVVVGIVAIPFCAWYYAALGLKRFTQGRRPAG
jgi:hypothetical protein